MYSLQHLPIFQELENARRVLIAGAGGGFDIYCGIPLFLALQKQNKEVFLANYSFTALDGTNAPEIYKGCFEVTASNIDKNGTNYFPEKYLSMWLLTQGMRTPVYSFQKTGIGPLTKAYRYLVKKLDIDTIILIDGGTDSLMLGDEEGLGTPLEDICSMAAAYKTGIERKFLVNIGFGVDHYHGVSHYHFLENVATLSKAGGYLGAFALLENMAEGQLYNNAVTFANNQMRAMESIVSNSVSSALEGAFGNYHKTARTGNSTLWINPLMSMYWCFQLDKVIQQNKYFDAVRDTQTLKELDEKINAYRNSITLRPRQPLPL